MTAASNDPPPWRPLADVVRVRVRHIGGIKRFREKYRSLKKEEVGRAKDGVDHWQDVSAKVGLSCRVSDMLKELEGKMKHPRNASSLNLCKFEFGDAGAKELTAHIEGNNELRVLRLGSNGIKARGMRVLAPVIAANTKIRELHLSNSESIGLQGVMTIAFALEGNLTLQTLNLRHNNMQDDGIRALSWITFNADEHSQELQTSGLTSLDLTGNKLGDSGMEVLSKVLSTSPTLTRLILGYNEISDDGAQALAVELEPNRTLTELDLQVNHIGERGGTDLMVALTQNQHLKSLNLAFNTFGSGRQGLLSDLNTLPGGSNFTLTEISLSRNLLTVRDLNSAMHVLVELKTLYRLDLSHNLLGAEGVAVIANALRRLPLQKLNMRGNGIGDGGVWVLCKEIKRHQHMKTIDVADNGIGDKGAWALIDALNATQRPWESVVLAKNLIGPRGALVVAATLKHSPGIKQLDLRDNPLIDERGAVMLVCAIRQKSDALYALGALSTPAKSKQHVSMEAIF
jgi:Ran GTPase-activating protein (RanGAP) involved in mRNA processing and transport